MNLPENIKSGLPSYCADCKVAKLYLDDLEYDFSYEERHQYTILCKHLQACDAWQKKEGQR